jgi:hypothetical protein
MRIDVQKQKRQIEKIMIKHPETIPTLRWVAAILLLKLNNKRQSNCKAA